MKTPQFGGARNRHLICRLIISVYPRHSFLCFRNGRRYDERADAIQRFISASATLIIRCLNVLIIARVFRLQSIHCFIYRRFILQRCHMWRFGDDATVACAAATDFAITIHLIDFVIYVSGEWEIAFHNQGNGTKQYRLPWRATEKRENNFQRGYQLLTNC